MTATVCINKLICKKKRVNVIRDVFLVG